MTRPTSIARRIAASVGLLACLGWLPVTALHAAGAQQAGRQASGAAAAPAAPSAQASLRNASARHAAGDTDAAILLLEKHLVGDADAVSVRRALVALLVTRTRYDKATEVLAEGLRRDPRDAEMAMVMSNLMVRAGDTLLAVKLLESSSGDGAAPAVNAQLARLLMQAGRPAESVAYWVKALGQGGGVSDWWLGLALALDAQGRSAEAREAFSRALQAGGRMAPAATDYARMRVAALE